MNLKTFPLATLAFLLPLLAAAQPADPSGLSPIKTKMDLGLFGVLGSGMEYRLEGKKLENYRDFKKVIYPLRDQEASDLIREAEADHFVAQMVYVAGAATAIDVGLAFDPTPLFHVDWLDRIATGLVVAQIFVGVGTLFDLNAEGRKYNAVQRYNHLVRQEEGAFFKLDPKLALGPHGIALVQGF